MAGKQPAYRYGVKKLRYCRPEYEIYFAIFIPKLLSTSDWGHRTSHSWLGHIYVRIWWFRRTVRNCGVNEFSPTSVDNRWDLWHLPCQRQYCLPVVIGRLSVHLSVAAVDRQHHHYHRFCVSRIVNAATCASDRHSEVDLSVSRRRVCPPSFHHRVHCRADNNFRFLYHFRSLVNNFRFVRYGVKRRPGRQFSRDIDKSDKIEAPR